MSRAHRRFDLVNLVVVYDNWRARNRSAQQWAEERLRNGMTRVGSKWTGSLDIAWFTAELTKVRALPGEYPPGSYERWRRHGLPAWAALAAGMRPTTTEADSSPPRRWSYGSPETPSRRPSATT